MNNQFYDFYYKVIIPWPCNPTAISIDFFREFEIVIEKTFQSVPTISRGKKPLSNCFDIDIAFECLKLKETKQ